LYTELLEEARLKINDEAVFKLLKPIVSYSLTVTLPPVLNCDKRQWKALSSKDRELTTLSLDETKTITVPTQLELNDDKESWSKVCPGRAKVELSKDAPVFVTL